MNEVYAARYWAKVLKTATCWIWTAGKTQGYGMFKAEDKKMHGAHRLSYEMHHGPIPAGESIDHMCRNRACVNPAHLRTVTNKQNSENRGTASSLGRSGVRGVFWYGRLRKWAVQVRHNGKLYRGGYFATIEEATEDVRRLRNELYTHNDADRAA